MLNRHSARPLYQQIVGDLEARVARLGAEDRLPSETELAREYGVNRLTVRQAVAELARRGLVVTVHGKGTFVASPTLRYRVTAGRDASFTKAMHDGGHVVDVTLLKSRTERGGDAAEALATTGPVRRLDLLRCVNGEPWSLTATWIPVERFPTLEEHWTGEASLYRALEERFGVRMRRANRVFAAAPADGQDSELLLLPVGSPVLVVRGLNVADDGVPVALVEHRFRSDRVEFEVGLE